MIRLFPFAVLFLGLAGAAFADHGKGAVGGKTITPRTLHADPVELALLAGIKLPTGSTGQLANSGSLLEPDHQPGSGSWDPLLGLAVARQFERLTVGSSVLYRITSEGRHDFRPGQQVL